MTAAIIQASTTDITTTTIAATTALASGTTAEAIAAILTLWSTTGVFMFM